MNQYYVYGHFTPNTNVPFYIGKGTGNRAWRKQNRNVLWYDIVNKHGYEVKILHDNLSESCALFEEINLITLYGRITDSTGILVNITSGGEGGGMTGRHHSEKTKQKIKMSNTGKTRSQETKDKISKIKTGKRPSEETKIKMSNAVTGENNPFWRKAHSPETINKIKSANTGNKNRLGKTHSEATRKKISDSKKKTQSS